ncbi:unnamed protein product [Candida verbasci]|uniref:Uncharacterized protein n=1 Tax=Candida verbasci TaxID=1227364 RepID=A0A9W4TSR6_9ASCO|nr:unnamed protein product [Candida verbasci]
MSRINYIIPSIFIYLIYVWIYVCPNSNDSITPINYHICKTMQPVIDPLNNNFHIDEKINLGINYLSKIDDSIGISSGLADYLQLTIDYSQNNIIPIVEKLGIWVESKLYNYFNLARIQFENYVNPYFENGWEYLRSISWINQVILFIDEYFQRLLQSKHAIKLQERSKFLQQEFKNLKVDLKNYFIPTDSEVETVVITSTVEVTDYSIETMVEDPIYEEIRQWDTKIENTIILAKNSIENDMNIRTDSIIDDIKPIISEHFQYLQAINHEQYKNLNLKIKEINKDYEKMTQSNDTIIETITRQEIRDDIKRSYNSAENCSFLVQNELTKNHQIIIDQYFISLQNTIDILESYADSTMNELLKIINNYEAKDESEKWNLLQKFHGLKNKLFDFRDELFNNANAYKVDNKKNPDVIGLKKWNEYLNNVEFHLNYLLRDNTEYLRLIRAQANIAFQLREELTNNINDKQ